MERTRSHKRKEHNSNNNNNYKKKKKKKKNNDKIYLPTCSSLRITFTSSCKMACDLEESELTPVAPVLRTPPPYSITCKETTSSVIKTGVKIYYDLRDDFSSWYMLSKSSKASSYGVCYYRYHYYTSINSSTL